MLQTSQKKTNEMAPNRDLTLKIRASKYCLGEYFGTKDKMAVIVQQYRPNITAHVFGAKITRQLTLA